jgi:hypothetical protein
MNYGDKIARGAISYTFPCFAFPVSLLTDLSDRALG